MTLFCTLSSRLPIIEFRTVILKKGGPCASGLFLSEGLLVFILFLSVDYNYYINLLKPTIQLELVKCGEAFLGLSGFHLFQFVYSNVRVVCNYNQINYVELS